MVFVRKTEAKMGTYTSNYNLFMPTVGETGWGTLVNTNFSTIDSTMKNLSNRITAVENEVNGALSCTSVTTSGKITGNGGIAGTTGTFSGAVTGTSFNGAPLKANSTYTVTPTNTLSGYLPVTTTNGAGLNLTILPHMFGNKYTGRLKFYNQGTAAGRVYYATSESAKSGAAVWVNIGVEAGADAEISFSNISYLVCAGNVGSGGTGMLQYYGFTLS